jgi:hypothetical protein
VIYDFNDFEGITEIAVRPPHPGPCPTVSLEEIYDLARSGLTISQIIDQTGIRSGSVERSNVAAILKEAGIPYRMGIINPRGPNSRRFDHAKAASLVAKGFSVKKVADLLGVSSSSVLAAVKEYEGAVV